MDFDLDQFIGQISSFGLSLLGAIVLLIAAWMVSRWARRMVSSSLAKTRLDVTLIKFFANISAWLILVLAVLTALSVFGINTTSFAAVIGAAGLAIGLALQGTLSNFAAGVMLLTFRPFKVGDAVTIGGETGVIDEIDLFMTKMDTFDNRRIVFPNSKVFGDKIETITFHATRRADVPVGTDYGDDLDHVRAVLEAAAASVEGGLTDPAPQVILDSFGDSSINWSVRVWGPTPDYMKIKQRTLHAIKRHLDDAGLSIPFPQLDLHPDLPLPDAQERRN